MKAFEKAITLFSYLALLTVLSCVIEDDWPNQKPSENLGRKLSATDGLATGLYWSGANEIITLGPQGVTAINAASNTVRKVSFEYSGFALQQYTWLNENMLYFMQFGNLSAVDLTTMTYQYALLDSVQLQTYSSPFNATHIAYGKYRPDDYGEPSIFLYDLKSGKEIYITSGYPTVFSPDGKQLLLTKFGKYHIYNLITKSITPLNFEISYSAGVVKWTPQGIISFETGNMHIVVTNETEGKKIGEWPTLGEEPNVSWISQAGNHMITTKYKCLNGDPSGDCPYQAKIVYSIVDVVNKEETELAETTAYYITLKAISPDQKNLVFIGTDNYIYVTEK